MHKKEFQFYTEGRHTFASLVTLMSRLAETKGLRIAALVNTSLFLEVPDSYSLENLKQDFGAAFVESFEVTERLPRRS